LAETRQIEEAEKEKPTHYYLSYHDRGGGFCEIEYGLVKRSGSGEVIILPHSFSIRLGTEVS